MKTMVRPSPSPTVRHEMERRLSLSSHAQHRSATMPTTDRRLSMSTRLDLPCLRWC